MEVVITANLGGEIIKAAFTKKERRCITVPKQTADLESVVSQSRNRAGGFQVRERIRPQTPTADALPDMSRPINRAVNLPGIPPTTYHRAVTAAHLAVFSNTLSRPLTLALFNFRNSWTFNTGEKIVKFEIYKV